MSRLWTVGTRDGRRVTTRTSRELIEIFNGYKSLSPTTRRLIHYLVITVIGLLLITLHLYYGFETFNTPDPYDYLQLARNIAGSSAFETNIVTPLSWSVVPELSHHPDLWRAPLYPTLIGAGFRLFGVHEMIPLVISGVSFLLGALLVHRITERLYDSLSGLAAGLLMVTFAPLLQFGLSAYTEAPYVLLTLVSVLIVLWNDEYPIVLGVVSGLAYLTRMNHWFFFAGVLWVGMRRSEDNRWRYAGTVLGTFVLVISPWMVRNVYHVGRPFYNHNIYLITSQNLRMTGYDAFFRFVPPEPLGFVLTNPGLVAVKWINNILDVYRWVPRYFAHAWIVAVLGLTEINRLVRRTDERARSLLWIYGLGFVVQGLCMSFVFFKPRHFAPYLVVVFILAGGALGRWWKKQSRTVFVVTLVGLLGINLYYVHAMDPWSPEITAPDYRAVRRYVPRDEPLLTNVPELTAWYAGRTSLWVTDYADAEEHYPSFRYVLFSPEVPRNPSGRTDIRTGYLRNGAFLEEFELIQTFPQSGSRLYRRVSERNWSR